MVRGTEDIMRPKAHGTTSMAVQRALRWGVDREVADNICSFNRHYAEHSGCAPHPSEIRPPGRQQEVALTLFVAELADWKEASHSFLKDLNREGTTTYCDSVTGKPLFVAPLGRSMKAFLEESAVHGWPSFRDEEVVWENVRILSDGEAVSVVSFHALEHAPITNRAWPASLSAHHSSTLL